MTDCKIIKKKLQLGVEKDIENTAANADRQQAILDYIAAMDYPEVFETEQEGIEE